MSSQAMMNLNYAVSDTKIPLIQGLLKRLASSRVVQSLFKAPRASDNDPYLLVLLADLELGEGREEQARHLVDAAYEAFDQKAGSTVSRMR